LCLRSGSRYCEAFAFSPDNSLFLFLFYYWFLSHIIHFSKFNNISMKDEIISIYSVSLFYKWIIFKLFDDEILILNLKISKIISATYLYFSRFRSQISRPFRKRQNFPDPLNSIPSNWAFFDTNWWKNSKNSSKLIVSKF
jgi:hypothetical protein